LNVLDRTGEERAAWWRAPGADGAELLRASYRRRTFARHAHDRFALGVIEAGALAFQYRGQDVIAPAGWVNLAYPGEAHTGRAAGAEGWRYRMFYLEPGLLREAALALDPDYPGSPFLAEGALADAELAGRVARLHRRLERPDADPLACRAELAELLCLLVERYGRRQPRSGRDLESRAVQRARELLADCPAQAFTLEQLAAVAGLNPFRLTRCFTRELGLPPHAYQVQLRLQRAAGLLRRGESPAAAAAEAGFADQSHLHRHFLKCYGVTPGAYRRG
jgi:AraC-like DNA-binding protein